MRAISRGLVLLGAVLCGSCGFNDFRLCPAPPADLLDQLPRRLSQTGLYQDLARDLLAPGVTTFTPQFQLWSDGAQKRRWILLPAGTRIDTSDMDNWQFPAGTKLWKEFARDGVRVETRLLHKLGPRPEDWIAAAYVWDQTAGDALLAPSGVVDAAGTTHDVPAASECTGCHGGRKSRALGFSAIQLAHDLPPDQLDLQALIDRDLLTTPPAHPPVVPGNPTERAALGYLHANCAHCHNQQRPGPTEPRCFAPENQLDFWLPVAALATPRATPTYRSANDLGFSPGDPDDSRLIQRMNTRADPFFASMPPLGTELVHDEALALLRRWITEMRP